MTVREEQQASEAHDLEQRLANIDQLLISRGAHHIPHSRWSLQQHLGGTLEILEHWRQPSYLCLAGLLHSAYSTESFSFRLLKGDDRALVRDLIGEQAESLVHLYCSLRQEDLIEASRGGSTSKILVPSRDDGTAVEVTPEQLGDLFVLHLANAAEQHSNADDSPTTWLAHASLLAKRSLPFVAIPPPIFNGSTKEIAHRDDSLLVSLYGTATSQAYEYARVTVERELAEVAEAISAVGEPFVWLGLLSLGRREIETACEFGEIATDLLAAWGTSWDKRLSWTQWRRLAAFLTDLPNLSDAELSFISVQTYRALLGCAYRPDSTYLKLEAAGALETSGASRWYPADAASASTAQESGAVPRRYLEYIAQLADDAVSSSMLIYPSLPTRPWYTSTNFPCALELERMAHAIIEEFSRMGKDFRSESEPIRRTGEWDVMMLFERGRRNDETCTQCPVTSRVIEGHRTIRGPAGLAYFSRLSPGTRVAPHRGPTNMRVRCHLGIDIPDGCGIRVDGVETTWRTGKCLVFDDSFTHEVWNTGDRDRIVLVVDLWHPDLSDREVALLEGLHRYAFFHASGLMQYWRTNQQTSRTVCNTTQILEDRDAANRLLRGA